MCLNHTRIPGREEELCIWGTLAGVSFKPSLARLSGYLKSLQTLAAGIVSCNLPTLHPHLNQQLGSSFCLAAVLAAASPSV